MEPIKCDISYSIPLSSLNQSKAFVVCNNQTDWIVSNSDSNNSLGLVRMLLTSLCLGGIILATIFGNALVITAVLTERSLRNFVANYLIASLAIADLLVALLVMPLAAVYEVTTRWVMGSIVCDMWTSFDILCCTSSIFHLVAIAVDRYLAVTRVDYIHRRSIGRVFMVVTLSWTLSFIISVPPLLGWRSGGEGRDGLSKTNGQCLISQDKAYTIYSTVGAFYLPLLFIIVLYGKIYRVARYRIYHMQFRRGAICAPQGPPAPAAHNPNETTVVQASLLAGSLETRITKQSMFSFPIYGQECDAQKDDDDDDCYSRDSSRIDDYDDIRGFDDDDDEYDDSSFVNSEESQCYRDIGQAQRDIFQDHKEMSHRKRDGKDQLLLVTPRRRRSSADKSIAAKRKRKESMPILPSHQPKSFLNFHQRLQQGGNRLLRFQHKGIEQQETQPAIRALARRSLKLFSEYTRVAMPGVPVASNRISKSEGKLNMVAQRSSLQAEPLNVDAVLNVNLLSAGDTFPPVNLEANKLSNCSKIAFSNSISSEAHTSVGSKDVDNRNGNHCLAVGSIDHNAELEATQLSGAICSISAISHESATNGSSVQAENSMDNAIEMSVSDVYINMNRNHEITASFTNSSVFTKANINSDFEEKSDIPEKFGQCNATFDVKPMKECVSDVLTTREVILDTIDYGDPFIMEANSTTSTLLYPELTEVESSEGKSDSVGDQDVTKLEEESNSCKQEDTDNSKVNSTCAPKCNEDFSFSGIKLHRGWSKKFGIKVGLRGSKTKITREFTANIIINIDPGSTGPNPAETKQNPNESGSGSGEGNEEDGKGNNDEEDHKTDDTSGESGKVDRRRLSVISLAKGRRRKRRKDSGPGESPISLRRALARRYAKQREKTRSKERKKERKAARTLAIVTGSFIVCWLPFFVVAILRPFCSERCHYPPQLLSIILWLGYVNSLLNPIIYTIFNRDFRRAFQRILVGLRSGRAAGSPMCLRACRESLEENHELMVRARAMGRRRSTVQRRVERKRESLSVRKRSRLDRNSQC